MSEFEAIINTFKRDIGQAYSKASRSILTESRRRSYIGTGELKRSWYAEQPRLGSERIPSLIIHNRARSSVGRIVGNPPGTVAEISALKQWIAAKKLNLNPYAVRANIKKWGTERWRTSENDFGMGREHYTNPDSDLKNDSFYHEANNRIARELNRKNYK